MMVKLYEFTFTCGYLGTVTGLFLADEDHVAAAIGKTLDFGDIFHIGREITYTLREDDLRVKSEDRKFLQKLLDVVGRWTIGGHNPLDYIKEEEEIIPDDLRKAFAIKLPEKLHFEALGGQAATQMRRFTRLGFRPPMKGEYYVSGARPAAYKAPNDLTTAYCVVRPLDDGAADEQY
jgi:hypothetical protein